MRKLPLSALILCISVAASAQTIIGRQLVDQYPITSYGTKTYGLTWLPADYNTTTTNYPLIIFLHAAGEVGDGVQGLYKLITQGLPKKIAAGWDPQAVNPADGKRYKFIVVSPQAPTSSGWSYTYTHVAYILPNVLSRYRIDPNRIYICGTSAGGAGTWSCVTNDSNFTKKIAAILPISAVGVNNPGVESPNIKYISGKYGVKVWTVCGTKDAYYNTAVSYVNTINTATPLPTVPAKLTGVAGFGHDTALWNIVLDSAWRSNAMNMTLYEWLLQYQRNVTSPPDNQPPIANAGADKSMVLPTNSVQLTGSGSDPDGSIASYQWTKISGPTQFTIVSPTQAQTVVNNLVAGVYQFELKVTDNKFTYRTDTVAITVTSLVNQTPVVNAGVDQTITLPANSVTLTGSGSDADGSIVSWLWSKVSGPTQFIIVSAAQPQTIINNLTQGVYQFELKATDNQGASKTDTAVVTVLPPPNQPPSVNAGNDQTIVLPINNTTFTGTASDADGTITSYLWTKIAGPSQFIITSPDQLQTAVTNLDAGTYQFELKVTDNQNASKADTVVVFVTLPPPNKIPVAFAGNDKNIYFPTDSILLSGTGVDTDGIISTYQWNKIAGSDQFVIAYTNQAQTICNGLTTGVYEFELTVTDNQGAAGKDTIVITVKPTDQPPVAFAGVDQTITLPVNNITLPGSGSDADGTIISYQWSKISGPSQYAITSANQAQTTVTNLARGVYQFELTVTDDALVSTKDTVLITVLPAPNQPPVANAGNDQTITLPVSSVTLLGNGTDADGVITSYAWSKVAGPLQYTIISPNQASTSINNLAQGVYQFELKVTDDSSASKTDTVIITVLAAPNKLPVANAGVDQTITLPTSSVSVSGAASDTDGTIINYLWTKISGPSQFNISNSNISNPVINNLVAGTYTFHFTATDNNGATAFDDMNVTVNPMLAGYKTVPARLQAESYNAMSGVKTENTNDAGGGLDVGWIDNGDWMDFNVYADSAGIYTVNFRVATSNNGVKFQLKQSNGTVLAMMSLPNTGSYQGWFTMSAQVSLPAGYQTLRIISAATLVWNINWLEFVKGAATGKPIPARIEAESYDVMQGIQMELTGDTGGGLDVGWIDNNDWLDYNLNAAVAGTYTVNLRVATSNTNAKLQIKKADGTVLSTVTIPKTGGFQTWSTVSTSVSLAAGQQTLRIISTTTLGWNFNWIEFISTSQFSKQGTQENISSAEENNVPDNKLSIGIIPNPVLNDFMLNVNSAEKGVVIVQIIDMSGAIQRQMKYQKNTKQPLQLPISIYNLSSGIYTVQVQIGKWEDSKRLVKQ